MIIGSTAGRLLTQVNRAQPILRENLLGRSGNRQRLTATRISKDVVSEGVGLRPLLGHVTHEYYSREPSACQKVGPLPILWSWVVMFTIYRYVVTGGKALVV